MHFIFGGRCMGKLEYAQSLLPNPTVRDLAREGGEAVFHSDIVTGVHLLVRQIMLEGGNPLEYFRENMHRFSGCILIGDEVGSGIVPVDAFEREWRDEVGRVYQLLSAKADDVTRVWSGIPQKLKRGGVPV